MVERILTDALIEKFNDAFVAGLQFSLVYTQEGNIAIQLGGFTHRILLLLENLLSEVENFIIEEDVFLLYIGKVSTSSYVEMVVLLTYSSSGEAWRMRNWLSPLS